MANYATEFCHKLYLPTSDTNAIVDLIRKAIEESPDDDVDLCGYDDVDDMQDDYEHCECYKVTVDRDIAAVTITDRNVLSIEVAARILQTLIDAYEIDEPVIFQWAHTCDRSAPGGFGGGAVLLRRGLPACWCDPVTTLSHLDTVFKGGAVKCTHCGHEMMEMGCKVTDLPIRWCPACGTIKPCDSDPVSPASR